MSGASSAQSTKGIGLFGLIGMVISSCIGSGVFAITGQLAGVSSPGASLIAWAVVGIGFLALSFSLNYLTEKRADLHGIFSYAREGFGSFAGFLSGWGYWLSAWLGNVAFATMMMSTLGYFFPTFIAGNTLPCVIVASLFMWLMTWFVIRGVESASFLNAIVMIAKVLAIGIFIVFSVFLFNAAIFTQDFFGTLSQNIAGMVSEPEGLISTANVPQQVINCMIILMWCFIGIEGATVISSRARRKSDVGKATVIGMICLLVIYIGASILPYGFMPYQEVAQLNYPAMLYVFEAMAPGWGGAFIAIAIIISVAGAWLSFTILPAETSADMADQKLLPESWKKTNGFGAPQTSLIIVGVCTQIFLLITMLAKDAYNFAFSLCTVSIVVTWALAAAYAVKLAAKKRNIVQCIVALIALIFQIVAVLFNGWSFLLLACAGYIPGFFVYAKARSEYTKKPFLQALTRGEVAGTILITAVGIIGLILVACGFISI